LDQDKLLYNYFLVFPSWLKHYIDKFGISVYKKPFTYQTYLGEPVWQLSNVVFLRIRVLNKIIVLSDKFAEAIVQWVNSLLETSSELFGINKFSDFYLNLISDSKLFWSSIQKEIPILKDRKNQFIPFINKGDQGQAFLGKLAIKLEPAGKIRVFAMVDAWTQWIMWPLHSWIFSILKQLPEIDGTFDQLFPVKRLQDKYASNDELSKGKTFSSIDLSSATDRLPLKLQQSVLRSLLRDIVPDSTLFSLAWGDLLVKRSYKLGPSIKKLQQEGDELPLGVKYTVGQPMGALSSWGMLALTHHAIVQYAAQRSGRVNWFVDYAILGDDIVIADAQVSGHYRQILSEIGVKAGLAKSIISRSKFVVEFAKKFFVDKTQADMLPLKECIATRTSTSLVLEFVRKYNLTLNSVLAFLGFGYKARSMAISSLLWNLSNRLRVLLVWLSHPNSPIGVRTKKEFILYPYTTWLLQSKWLSLFNEVSHGDLCWINGLLHGLLWQKTCNGEDMLTRYEKSAFEFVNEMDKNSPIYLNMDHPISTDAGKTVPQLYSWSRIITKSRNTIERADLDTLLSNVSSPSVGFEDVLYYTDNINAPITVNDIKKQLRPSRDPFIRSADLGIKPFNSPDLLVHVDYEALEEFVESKPEDHIYQLDELIKDHGSNNPLIQLGIEVMLEDIFSPHIHKTVIPMEFWGEEHAIEKAFSDFLEVFKLWTKLTKRTWSEYYKRNNKVAPKQFLDPQKVTNIMNENAKPGTNLIVRDESTITYIETPFGVSKLNKRFDLLPEGSIRSFVISISRNLLNFIRIFNANPSTVILNLFLTFTANMLSGENIRFGHGWTIMNVYQELVGYKNWFTSILNPVSLVISNIYKILNRVVDLIVLVIMLIVIGNLYWSIEEDIDWGLSEMTPGTSEAPSNRTLYLIGGMVLLAGLVLLGFDMYSSYQTTLNYIDPVIKPLYLPSYAGIPEVIPSGLGRSEIISIFEPTTLGHTSSELLLSPASPYQMHGFWE